MNKRTNKTLLIVITTVVAIALMACGPLQSGEPGDPSVGSSEQGIKMPPLASFKINFAMVAQAKRDALVPNVAPDSQQTSATSGKRSFKHVFNATLRSGAASLVVGAGLAPYANIYGTLLGAGFTWDGKALVASASCRAANNTLHPCSGRAVPNFLGGIVDITIRRDGRVVTSGSAKLDATGGTWTLHDFASGADAVRVQWSATRGSSLDVAGEIVDASHKHFGTTASIAFDAAGVATLTYDVKPGAGQTTVVLDTVSREGSIQAPDYNGGAQGCWDGKLLDAPCQ